MSTEIGLQPRVPQPSCGECRVRSMALYAQLPVKDIERLRRDRRLVRARRTIIREGEKQQEVYTIFEGWAFSYQRLGDGRRQILSFLLPGEFISLQSLRDESPAFSVQALTDVLLCSFRLEQMCELLASQSVLASEVQSRCLAYAASLEDRLTDIGRRNAEERIASLLLDLHGRIERRGGLNEDGSCPFPLRQEHIADALGLTPVHVSRVLTQLKTEQLVTLRPGFLTLLDVRRLHALVDGGRS